MKEITPEYLASQGLSETFPQRFWPKVDKNGPVPAHCPELGPCWVWTGGSNENGYGIVWKGLGKTDFIKAHRAAWILEFGNIPKEFVCHHCDNPICVRPTHLFPGTRLDNMRDAVRKNRVHPGEKHGMHKLTLSQVFEIRKQHIKWTKNHAALAHRYGVSVTNIRHILYYKSWKHVTPDWA